MKENQFEDGNPEKDVHKLETSDVPETQEVGGMEGNAAKPETGEAVDMEALLHQEKIHQECLEEAKQLEVKIKSLNKDINKLGGPEKFKEHFEAMYNAGDEGNKKYEKIGMNNAGAVLEENKKERVKEVVKTCLYLLGTAALSAVLIKAGMYDEGPYLGTAGSSGVGASGILMMQIAPLALAGAAFESLTKKWQLEIEGKIQALKFKMTGTKIDRGTKDKRHNGEISEANFGQV